MVFKGKGVPGVEELLGLPLGLPDTVSRSTLGIELKVRARFQLSLPH